MALSGTPDDERGALDCWWVRFENGFTKRKRPKPSIQERLELAFGSLIWLKADDFPPEYRERFVHLSAAIGNKESIGAATSKMDDDTAYHLAHEVVSLYDAIVRIHSLETPEL